MASQKQNQGAGTSRDPRDSRALQCTSTKDDLLKKPGRYVDDFCPICGDYGKQVRVGAHPSAPTGRDASDAAAPLIALVGNLRPSRLADAKEGAEDRALLNARVTRIDGACHDMDLLDLLDDVTKSTDKARALGDTLIDLCGSEISGRVELARLKSMAVASALTTGSLPEDMRSAVCAACVNGAEITFPEDPHEYPPILAMPQVPVKGNYVSDIVVFPLEKLPLTSLTD